MNSSDFEFLSSLLYKQSGLVLTPDKGYLLETRLQPVARSHGLNSIEQIVSTLRSRRDERLVNSITDAMTTNESLFFRDRTPFEQFKTVVLPKLLETRAAKKQIRIWSAACSSGQEPYSLSMILDELSARLAGWRIEIIATDISSEMIARARSGIYSQFEVQRGLPVQLLVKYFQQDGDRWQLNEKIRRMVTFREFNLLQDPRALGNFDVVFCRNVLIYFDQNTKRQVLDGISRQMAPDGYLYLGGAETVISITDKFQPVKGQRGMYMPTGAGGQKAAI
ncbi:MAG: protein-glutamate O-methyltransferase CheR [Nisaea sp.]|jgi:chemotaxis protein methyltransferase CheR|uniref:CheR family methyltransferase n=1 Tax=Nisaea sp. TaxID=2024842 RepID=UPI001B2A456E|nr:protein-glutamate O-methyltransferase CheR [Nisaea sp.]MBO6560017.1 protein-glutamate O-methyltransferase CheR [Nisaea sp.]